MKPPTELRVKIFADGADLAGIVRMCEKPWIRGFTTNPTLMRQAGVRDYRGFARDLLAVVPDRPVSFEIFSDEFHEMERQAYEIASWGENVYVKIPVTNTSGHSSAPLLNRLSAAGVRLNITAILTTAQVREVASALDPGTSSFISVFAGRIADTGRCPLPAIRESLEILEPYPRAELIWASCRELLNIVQADELGCHIITVPHSLLGRVSLIGKDLDEFSRETVTMFYEDAARAGFSIETGAAAALPA